MGKTMNGVGVGVAPGQTRCAMPEGGISEVKMPSCAVGY
jgi:hypothetical protein